VSSIQQVRTQTLIWSIALRKFCVQHTAGKDSEDVAGGEQFPLPIRSKEN